MIFVTVGTHEQSFDRLLKCIDKMIDDGKINEEVFCQKGFTEYEPKNYKSEKLLTYEVMQNYIKEARIVITHGGPASFLDPLKYGKIPIVVPRKKELNEHVNNHQLEFSKEVASRMNNIIVAENDYELEKALSNYDKIVKKMSANSSSNNENFCKKLKEEILNLF